MNETLILDVILDQFNRISRKNNVVFYTNDNGLVCSVHGIVVGEIPHDMIGEVTVQFELPCILIASADGTRFQLLPEGIKRIVD
ncbi:MAG TPA: hypothetical protein DCY84_01930 [Firmicutes bacterium]|nr:hypothetical protein [Bacillota bacterium]